MSMPNRSNKYVPPPKRILALRGITTQREWKQLKRQQWRTVMKALDDFRLGCAYCNGYQGPISRALDAMDDVSASLSAKEWGR